MLKELQETQQELIKLRQTTENMEEEVAQLGEESLEIRDKLTTLSDSTDKFFKQNKDRLDGLINILKE